LKKGEKSGSQSLTLARAVKRGSRADVSEKVSRSVMTMLQSDVRKVWEPSSWAEKDMTVEKVVAEKDKSRRYKWSVTALVSLFLGCAGQVHREGGFFRNIAALYPMGNEWSG
jgi:hypothetical protein